MTDQEQGTTTMEGRASIVGFVDVQVIDDGGAKVLVRLGQINNGEPVDVAVVVMAPETANILSAKLADAAFDANWARYHGFIPIDGTVGQSCPARQAGVGHGIALLLGAALVGVVAAGVLIIGGMVSSVLRRQFRR